MDWEIDELIGEPRDELRGDACRRCEAAVLVGGDGAGGRRRGAASELRAGYSSAVGGGAIMIGVSVVCVQVGPQCEGEGAGVPRAQACRGRRCAEGGVAAAAPL